MKTFLTYLDKDVSVEVWVAILAVFLVVFFLSVLAAVKPSQVGVVSGFMCFCIIVLCTYFVIDFSRSIQGDTVGQSGRVVQESDNEAPEYVLTENGIFRVWHWDPDKK